MAKNLTDVDEFTATIAVPENGEPADAANLESLSIQRLANRTRNLKNRVDGHDPVIARFEITEGSASPVGLVSIDMDSGVSLEDGDTSIQLPEGEYLVAVSCLLSTSSTSDNLNLSISALRGGTLMFKAENRRWSTNTNHFVQVSNAHAIEITTPTTQRISFTLFAETGTPSVLQAGGAADRRISIAKVG